MSDRLPPGLEAQARIQALSQKQFQAFFDEVPATAMQRVARYLPSVDGFRKTSQAGMTRQKEALARRLSRPGAQEQDYHGLYLIWRSWIDEKLPNAELIQELVDDVEEAAERPADADARRVTIEEHVDSLLEKLKEESQQNRCTREQIERLYMFSPFPNTPAAQGIISAAKTAADIDRDATLNSLPTRLRQDEDDIQAIKSELKSLNSRLESTTAGTATALAELPKLQSAIAEAKAAADNAHEAVLELGRLAKAAPPAEAGSAEGLVTSLSGAVDGLRNQLHEVTLKIGSLTELPSAVADLQLTHANFLKDEQQRSEQIASIAAGLEDVKRDVTALMEERTQPDQVAPLITRLDEFQRRLETLAAQPTRPYQTKHLAPSSEPAPRGASAGLRWEPLSSESTPTTVIDSHSGLVNVFTNALQGLGLRNTSAQIFAEECAAAVVARQAIFLQGAFSTDVARTLARVLGGAGSARLSVPIGLQDGEDLRLATLDALSADRTSIGAMAVEGLNRTSFDVLKEPLSDCLNSTVSPSNGSAARVAIFASITRGLASLPVEPNYFELGPVFDLDYLEWRSNPLSDVQPSAGTISAEIDRAIYARVLTTAADTEEVIRLARSFGARRNPSLERTFGSAYRALHLLRAGPKTPTQLQSLYFGWLLPYWRVIDVPKD